MTKVIALIDGEHYPPVIKDALDQLRVKNKWQICAGLLLGGTEKIKSEKDLEQIGVPVFPLKNISTELEKYMRQFQPGIVVDLSDEPVIGYKERFRIAGIVLKNNAVYQGADFKFTPPTFKEKIENKPTITIFGTGKRIGKTAVSAAVSKTLVSMGFNPVVVAMGRGGPEKPELLNKESEVLTAEKLLEYSNAGRHASSDHFENALMSHVTTIGCRRCGGGMAGQTFISNVEQGAELANKLENDIVVFDGSGAAIPPIKTDIKILVISAAQPFEYFEDYFGPYRISISDIVIITMAEEPMASAEKINAIKNLINNINPQAKIITTFFRPEPMANKQTLENKTAILATTAPKFMIEKIELNLSEKYNIKIRGTSTALSNRPVLRTDLENYSNGEKIDIILVELKAAAIDVVVNFAKQRKIQTVFVNNLPILLNGRHFGESLSELLKSRFR